MKPQRNITLEIHCCDLPGTRFEERSAVRLGIQRDKDVIEDVSADVESVTFTFSLRVSLDAKTGKPNFLGPFAQGKPGDRFFYLCWGERTENGWDGFRRAKVSLQSLDWDRLERVWETGEPVRITAGMTDRKGGPVCGTIDFQML